MMSNQDLHSFSYKSLHSHSKKKLISKNGKKQLDNIQVESDLEFIEETAVEAAKLSNSWISLENSMEKIYIEDKQQKGNNSLQKQCKVSLELSASNTDNSSKSDLYKLGYVIPDKETITYSANSNKFAMDSDDPGIVFVSSQSYEDSKHSDIVVIDSELRQQSFHVEKSSLYPNLSSTANTTDSFCDLAAISSSPEKDTTWKLVPSGAHGLYFDACKNSTDEKAHSLYPSSFCANESLLYLQSDSDTSLDVPSKFIEKNNVMQENVKSEAPQSDVRYTEKPVPQPPPEMGLPDLTKKQYFPRSSSEEASDLQNTDTSAIVKNKVLGLWNNVKYAGWNVGLNTNFSRSHPIVLLGSTYSVHPINKNFNFSSDLVHINRQNSVSFQEAFLTITWLTYRTKLPPITINLNAQESQEVKPHSKMSPKHLKQVTDPGTASPPPAVELTSDCGWGCTLRCTQMMLCHAIHKHFLGDDWVYTPDSSSIAMKVHSRLVRWFGDGNGEDGVCPLSLHQMLQCGYDKLGKMPGDWYSPSNAAAAIRDAVDAGSQYMPDLERITVYSVANNIIYIQDILEQCWTPCICKMGKIAEYVKQQPPKQRSCCRSGSCDNALHFSLRSQQLGRPGNSASADMLATSFNDTTEGFQSFVQVESLPCEVGPIYSNRPTFKGTHVNGDVIPNGGRLHARNFFGRSLSVDESENYNTSLPRELSDSGGSETFMNESFCELDYPGSSPLAATPAPMYPKPSISQKFFSSYMPFKFGSKNASGKSKSDYCSPVSVSTTCGKTRQESLQCDTIELLSPILEQERLCSDCHSWRSLVIILAVRLGCDGFNSIYEPVITGLLRHRLCIGMVGGKAKRAFYFVGYQEDQLLYLDPHVSQDAVPCSWSTVPDVAAYHCDTPRKMPISRLEPSATLGFYCHTRVDFAQLVVDLHKMTTVREGRLSYPLVEVKAGSRQQQESIWAGEPCILTDVVTLDAIPDNTIRKNNVVYTDRRPNIQGELNLRTAKSSGDFKSHGPALNPIPSAGKSEDFQILE
ncbi:uncharacterized protein LOC108674126 isoform X2 [Hyalella azteca]|uniref:Uncharacterized protein LOC108674126 isoform X2 n=1 Tax=Hyalella azteca TaxID=294128 RepID=A0A979FNY2_HYAAZ|nr:uncharacterized protein LOC108674126 isoform X2 [Hyalella azteca]